MKELVASFPGQLHEALAIALQSEIKSGSQIPEHVIITGMGGSGIGGRIVSQIVSAYCPVPVICVSDYVLPAFAGKKTLVIISSYSGDTEETLAAMHEALQRGCIVSCITSGGRVAELARGKNLNLILVPGGNPPRSMLGYSIVQLLRILHAYGLGPGNYREQIEQTVLLLNEKQLTIQNEAMDIASRIQNRIPIFYSEASYEGLAIRWRQQINENAKMLCWHHVLPEMNHNELVGWTGGSNKVAVVLLRTSDDHPRTKIRMDICKRIFSRTCDTVIDVFASGNSRLERTFYLNHVGDWLSLHLATLQGIDPVAIPDIDFLKNELSNV